MDKLYLFTPWNIYNLLWKILEFHMILFTLWFFSWYVIVVLAFFCNILIKKWSTSSQNSLFIWLIPVHIATNYIPKIHYEAILQHMYPVSHLSSDIFLWCLTKFWFSIPAMPNKELFFAIWSHIYLINLLLNSRVLIVSYDLNKCDTACVMYEGWNFNFGNTMLDWIQALLEWRGKAAGRMGPSSTYIHNGNGPSRNGHTQ